MENIWIEGESIDARTAGFLPGHHLGSGHPRQSDRSAAAVRQPDTRNETISQHVVSHPEKYGVVCAFHEHPLGFARPRNLHEIRRTSLCRGPSRDLAITKISNFVLNAPPHDLSWWNEDAFQVLADRLDLLTEAIEAVPYDAIIYWMRRCAPKLIGNRYFRAHWIWYGALLGAGSSAGRGICVPSPNAGQAFDPVASRAETGLISGQSLRGGESPAANWGDG